MAYRQNNSQGRNDRVRFDLMERIGVLSRKDSGWTREVNIVAWNDGPGKVDIREWDPEHKRMTKGITLFEDEAERLVKVLARRYGLSFAGGGQNRGRSFGEMTAAPAGRRYSVNEEDAWGGERSAAGASAAPAGASADWSLNETGGSEAADRSFFGSDESAASSSLYGADVSAAAGSSLHGSEEAAAADSSLYGSEENVAEDSSLYETESSEEAACVAEGSGYMDESAPA